MACTYHISTDIFLTTSFIPHHQSRPRNHASAEKCAAESENNKVESQWTARYNELVAYKEQFWYCSVPHHYDPNPTLGGWVHGQHTSFKEEEAGLETYCQNDRNRIRLWEEWKNLWTNPYTSPMPTRSSGWHVTMIWKSTYAKWGTVMSPTSVSGTLCWGVGCAGSGYFLRGAGFWQRGMQCWRR